VVPLEMRQPLTSLGIEHLSDICRSISSNICSIPRLYTPALAGRQDSHQHPEILNEPSRTQYASAMSTPGDDPLAKDLSSHPGVARVLEILALHHIRTEVRYLPEAVRTAAAAAAVLGVTPAEIANSLVFRATSQTGEVTPLLILSSGGHRVDVDKVADLTEIVHIEQADPEFVRATTGFAIGGVAPVGHPQPIRTIVDVSLSRYDTVWAAAGHSHSVFSTTYDELLRITGGQPMEVT
jgi:prolyl-tRNA editing enzyme YbaK/EbsC (Cys-tRNA(Pro) deacylase)